MHSSTVAETAPGSPLLPRAKLVSLTITGMEVVSYQSAVSINGNRNNLDAWIGGVKLQKNRFSRIGSFLVGQKPATAAIRLVNARSVLIESNEFRSIRNITNCGGMHSVYMAHNSIDNRVVRNYFADGCGETIKVRDGSNNNIVELNRFALQEGSALMLDSYCDSSTGAECTKTEPECPSWNNVFRENTIEGVRPASNKRITGARRAAQNLPTSCVDNRGGSDRISEERTTQR